MNICITRFGIRIGDRKYLNEYTPFGSVSLWAWWVWDSIQALSVLLWREQMRSIPRGKWG